MALPRTSRPPLSSLSRLGAPFAALLLLLAGLSASSAPTPVRFANMGFEEGDAGWDFSAAKGTASVVKDAAVTGAGGLRLQCKDKDPSIAVASEPIPTDTGRVYRLTWRGRVLYGGGTCIYLRFLDAAGKELSREEGRINDEKGTNWVSYGLTGIPPSSAVSMQIWVQRPPWRPPVSLYDLDDFACTSEPVPETAPWAGTYKLRPDEKNRLTEADVPGPDGRVYPNWRMAGVPGGIPDSSKASSVRKLDVPPGTDLSKLIETAAEDLARTGGGVIRIGEGTFVLGEPVLIRPSNVVIVGAGSMKTRLEFRYHIPLGELRFFRIKPGQKLGAQGTIEFHVNPKNLVALELRSGTNLFKRDTRKDHWGDSFSMRLSASTALARLGPGPRTFTGIGEYEDGRRVEGEITVDLSADDEGEPFPVNLGAITFIGSGFEPNRVGLAADGKRGDRVLTISNGHRLLKGDRITLIAPASERFRKRVGHESAWGIQAQDIFEIVAVDGNRITLHQPLRIDFPADDGSFVQKAQLVSGCGIEGLTLEQVEVPDQGPKGARIPSTGWYAIEDLWTSGVIFQHAWGCWAKDVTVRNACRNAMYFPLSKHVEARDCLFDEALFKGGGGTGYVGFDRSWDCLMDRIEARGMRHGPNCQWNASGNVVRNSRFLGSDAQWHAGFTLENLYENNFIDATGSGGSYGHGMYASGPSSGLHGPQGPRNVVYRNDVIARNDGIHMLGGNEAWIFLHNRVTVGEGRSIVAKQKSFDHVFAGNVFLVRKETTPTVFLGVESAGVEMTDNRFYGVSSPWLGFVGGKMKLAVDRNNVAIPALPESTPPLPRPEIESIFQWQRDHPAPARPAN